MRRSLRVVLSSSGSALAFLIPYRSRRQSYHILRALCPILYTTVYYPAALHSSCLVSFGRISFFTEPPVHPKTRGVRGTLQTAVRFWNVIVAETIQFLGPTTTSSTRKQPGWVLGLFPLGEYQWRVCLVIQYWGIPCSDVCLPFMAGYTPCHFPKSIGLSVTCSGAYGPVPWTRERAVLVYSSSALASLRHEGTKPCTSL